MGINKLTNTASSLHIEGLHGRLDLGPKWMLVDVWKGSIWTIVPDQPWVCYLDGSKEAIQDANS